MDYFDSNIQITVAYAVFYFEDPISYIFRGRLEMNITYS